ncbi:hypothetical protein [Pedobacter africanus]|uniref:hypothetical protein n=1 Tax=Pedobacter africanus TaxID=151894 RepID=UPI000A06F405|nr:hypothetical protein [Pedobacter africanus]
MHTPIASPASGDCNGLVRDESQEDFNRHEVFDVYRLDTGGYSHSLYVPRHPKMQLTDFAVRGNLLIALFDRYLVTYKLSARKGE